MAHIWQMDKTAWVRHPLTGNYFALGAGPVSPVQPAATLPASDAAAALGCYESGEQTEHWILFSKEERGASVNGQPLLAGITVLRDRDEILLGGRTRLYFSTEELAKVEPFPGSDGPVFCSRCRQPVQPGTPAVLCPCCGHWCEQSETKPCWTYGPTCPLCEQPTAFDNGLRWTPETL